MIDGKGQVRGADGYGWVARYLHGRQITYCAPADTSIDTPTRETSGVLRVADWQITAELKSRRRASLLIQRTDGGAALAVNRSAVKFGGTTHKSSESQSLLIEQAGHIIRRCGDEIPTAAR